MIKKNRTLRKQFLIRILSILLLIAIISGIVQLYLMKGQIVSQTNQQAEAVASNVLRGIEETDLATKMIEHQIDLKLVSYSKHIAELLKDKEMQEITKEDLIKIRDNLGLAGITVFAETESKDDIVGLVATEKEEVGFSFKEAGFFEIGQVLLYTDKPELPAATYTEKHIAVLPTVQSASHKDKPYFFKYAYYHVPGTKYIINPYIKANEVYNYIKTVGPSTTINKLMKESRIVEEIALLNPNVFKNPDLEKQLYPPMNKIDAGSFNFQTSKDTELLIKSSNKQESYIEKVNGKKVYKMFLPLDENRVIYLALDYEKMSGPLYRHSIILIVSSLISLLALFLLTAGFFNRIYENIQKIASQIKLLEAGDLTAKSIVNDKSELDILSKNTNRMVDKWNQLLKDTQVQANKTQRLSVLLEAEASQSVEKMYTLSTETTIKSREQLYEITEFLDAIIQVLKPYNNNINVKKIIDRIEVMREIATQRTAATTDITLTLSDLLQSLHCQSSELSDISNSLLKQMEKFKL